ncbi:unnamed protein product [Rangifer tarandus platyrhynchus]|uniref:Uncharacterized protein n=2 Tax=Rangifer tarandus platyrhynchus TaxID=3082113 RepID=A0AC59ZRV4_RANTA|nr:unnamed protein product [Rangifer tarandus platyrhynchus]
MPAPPSQPATEGPGAALACVPPGGNTALPGSLQTLWEAPPGAAGQRPFLKVARREATSPFSRILPVCWCLGPKGWVGPGLERSGPWPLTTGQRLPGRGGIEWANRGAPRCACRPPAAHLSPGARPNLTEGLPAP